MNRLCPGCGHVLDENAWYDYATKTWYCKKDCRIKELHNKGEHHKQKFIKDHVRHDPQYIQGGLFD